MSLVCYGFVVGGLLLVYCRFSVSLLMVILSLVYYGFVVGGLLLIRWLNVCCWFVNDYFVVSLIWVCCCSFAVFFAGSLLVCCWFGDGLT